MADELIVAQMKVAGGLVESMVAEGFWQDKAPEKMAREIAAVYRIIYDAICEAQVGQGGGPRKAKKKTL